MATPGALALVDDETIFSRIQAGEHASVVAQSLGVHKSALSHRFKGRKEYEEARELGTEIRLTELEIEIAELSKPLPKPDLAEEPTEAELLRYKVELKNWQMDHAEREFNLACLRERYKAVSWRAEREFPARWGAKGLTINIKDSQVTIGEALAGDARALLDRLREVEVQSDPG